MSKITLDISHPEISKQWHPNKFADVAKYCESKNYKVCVVGTKLDLISARPILTKCKNVINKIESSPPEIIYSLALISSIETTFV